jgi:hypothetical protein
MFRLNSLGAFSLGFFFCLFSLIARAQSGFDKSSLYLAMAGTDTARIDEELRILGRDDFEEKSAYEGALLMRKAGLIRGPAHKLKIFKSGHQKLESALSAHEQNTEYHFLRLMIQENTPGILGYKDNMDEDARIVKVNYSNLPEPVRRAVEVYSKKSKKLNPADFNHPQG